MHNFVLMTADDGQQTIVWAIDKTRFFIKKSILVNLSLLWANQSVTKFQSINFKVESDLMLEEKR